MPHSAPIHSSVTNKPGGLSTSQVVLAHPQVAEVMQVEINDSLIFNVTNLCVTMQHGVSGTPPRHAGLQSVALMSPMMFASASATNEQSVELVRVQTPVQRPTYQSREESQGTYLADNEITPLTKAQLMQAFNYLLKVTTNQICFICVV